MHGSGGVFNSAYSVDMHEGVHAIPKIKTLYKHLNKAGVKDLFKAIKKMTLI